MLHPVGDLPAAVYWRRRLLVLLLLVAVFGGGGWLVVGAATGRITSWTTTEAAARAAPLTTPALELVAPSLASVQTPTPVPTTTARRTTPPPPAPVPGGPCTDDMIALAVRAPASAPPGAKPTFELVVTNTSPVPCVRPLDKGLQEIVLVGAGNARIWGSNDCFPEASSDPRTLAPGEAVSLPLVWGGRSSAPGCTAPRVVPPAGDYVLRGRLDTKTSPDTPFHLG